VLVTSLGVTTGCSDPHHALQVLQFEDGTLSAQLEPLARSIGDSRIVLLGENGHGVGSLSELKVDLIEWLYQELGFEVLVFESGFFECGHVWRRIDSLEPADALLQCLKYPFQHAELLPLFSLAKRQAHSERPLELAGMDIQAQGYDSEPRPAAMSAMLTQADPVIGRTIASMDTGLYLPAAVGGLGDEIHAWAYQHADSARALYRTAAASVDPWARWVFRMSQGWIERLAVRGAAEAVGSTDRPIDYYQIRDEWMARAVSALADSIAGPRKVVVWLHNDHGRYGDFSIGTGQVRSVGGMLRDQYGSAVYSIGLFMGPGQIADNGRNTREVASIEAGSIEDFMSRAGGDASYLVLRDNSRSEIKEWADSLRRYLRMGLDPQALVPSDEFDALVYVRQARLPDYGVR
jgi:erythromycin esterase